MITFFFKWLLMKKHNISCFKGIKKASFTISAKKALFLLPFLILVLAVNGQRLEEQLLNQLWVTSDTHGLKKDTWTKFGEINVTGAWQDYASVVDFIATGAGNSNYYYGRMIFRFKNQRNTVGPITHWSFLLQNSNLLPDNLAAVSNGTKIELFVRIPNSYTRMLFTRVLQGVSGSFQPFEKQAFVDNLPSGDLIRCHSANVTGLNWAEKTDDWNSIWQGGFFEGHQEHNAPEQNGWFWGINMNHSSNNPDYKYGGQILIKDTPSTPTMYFRSRGQDGNGTWARILHSIGNQKINGGLTVDGVIKTEEIKVEVIAANSITLSSKGQTADFVFSPNYKLRSISEIESFIIENQHLPDIPSAEEMEAEGVNLAEMNKLLLMKIEELTLYVIEKEKEMQEIRNLKMEEEKKRVGLELQMKEVLNILKQTSERLDEIENSKI